MPTGRAYWKGHLKLSLVTCAVALYPASSQAEKTHFHQINRKTGNRLRQQMVDEATGKVVGKDEKGRGYEIAKGKYVEIEKDDLEAIEVESAHTIDIDTFVPEAEIDKRYYNKPYYVAPDDKSGEEAFGVIRDAMKNKGKVALARIVFSDREHIMAIEPWGRGMLATTLRYDYEVRNETEIFSGISTPRVDKEMVQLASHILDKKAGHFDPAKFRDHYEMALRELVQKKAAGKTIERHAPAAPGSNVIDLMAALKQSLGGGSKAGASESSAAGKASRPASRPSPRRKPAARGAQPSRKAS